LLPLFAHLFDVFYSLCPFAAHCIPEIITCMEKNNLTFVNQPFAARFDYDKNIACSNGNYDKMHRFNSLDKVYKDTKEMPDYYPSSYRQNVLVMLAKRLIDEGYGDVSRELARKSNNNNEEQNLDMDQMKVTVLSE